jgi:hypothetical protein
MSPEPYGLSGSAVPVSIHLLANDTGCVLRHVYDERTGDMRPFRSGYVNAACPEGAPVLG